MIFLKRVCLSGLFFFFLSAVCFAGDTPSVDIFKEIADDAAAFFTPISGAVTGPEVNGVAGLGIGRSHGVREGMRLRVFRETDDFVHPVTGEVLGKVETKTGFIEVVSADKKRSTIRVLEGDVKIGDSVRISKGTLPVLFYQTRDVDWAVGDALFKALRDTGRFDVIETEVDRDDTETMLTEVSVKKAVFGVFAARSRDEGGDALSVCFYHPDGIRFYSKEIRLSEPRLKELKFGYNFLKEVDSSLRLSFEVPSSTDFISSCDVDGAGDDELVMIVNTAIEVFRFGVDLKMLYNVRVGFTNEVIRCDCGDLNGNKKSEIVVTSLVNDKVVSDIFELDGGELKNVHHTEGFLRIMDGGLYRQEHSVYDAYSGPVYHIADTDGWETGKRLLLPEGVNIYDFTPVNGGYLVVDDYAHINLYNGEGVRIWRSEDALGEFPREYEISPVTVMMQPVKWYVKDRVLIRDGVFLMMKRSPVAEKAKGLGSLSADIIGVAVEGAVVKTTPVLKDIGGTMKDFAIIDGRLAVLVRPFLGFKPGNILKGKNPFKSNLYVFQL